MPGPADTEPLLLRALAGQPGALDELLDHVRPRLVIWVAGRLSAPLRRLYDPEDVTQELLLAVCRDFPRFRGRDRKAFLAWCYAIGQNTINDLADREGAQKRRLPEPVPFSQTSPSQRAIRLERVSRVLGALARLDEESRAVIVLRVVEERSIAELAELWRCSPNAVRIRCFRALERLREALDAESTGSAGAAAGA